MPIISKFYGIIIRMYFKDNKQHKFPHIHAFYAGAEAIFDFEGKIIEGKIPIRKQKIVEAWIIIHKKELEELWKKAINGEGYFKIKPLK